MTTLEQLKNELNESLNAQYLLRESLKNNTKALEKVEILLKELEAHLKYSNEFIYNLKQENRKLELSCDAWMKRAIKLEFEVLRAHDAKGL